MRVTMEPKTIHVSASIGDVEAVLVRPDDAKWVLVLAHGAGAGMHHPFMERLASEFADCGVATFRYQFPYMQQRRKRPDPPAVLIRTVRTAIRAASEAASSLPLFAGGKSLGARMTSLACAEERSSATSVMTRVRGLVFFGFPLHPAGRPDTVRGEHLPHVHMPMLFLQGTRDALADLAWLRPVCEKLAPYATLHVIDGADHSFHMRKRSGTNDASVLRELARTVALWGDARATSSP
jgi:predicted alpha/beta-hydrolase family hydrolase